MEKLEIELIEALKSGFDFDTIDYGEVLDMVEMKKRIRQAKAMHPYEIHHTEKSGWFTCVDDETQPGGKRKIRKCSEENLWEALAEWYIDNPKNISLKELYPQWLEWKTTPRNQENIKRISAAWNAYYLKEPMSEDIINKPLSRLTPLMLRNWAESLLKKHYPVDKRKFSRMFTIVNQCLEYAADEDIGILSENTWQKARKKINRELIFSNPLPSDEEQVFTDDERKKIMELVHQDLDKYKKQPTSAGLQILFLFVTGLRIGECCGLKWSDIHNDRLYIRRQATNEVVKEWTKSMSGYRDIPLTEEAKHILCEVEAYNAEHNYTAEWIFQSDNPKYDYRLSYNAADRKLRKLCARMDTVTKSPHKCRKTCISALLDCPEVNNRTVQRFAGHKDLSTTFGYYSFERRTKTEQAKAIDRALAI
ncbi:MAG: site-specific integrase [Lachnospiraceae bacterium]|nr:site-specific integrase [Lachnospiraceae bacterium]